MWGAPFADEIRSTLKVGSPIISYFVKVLIRSAINIQFNARGVVAMANSGKDSESNKSQFFIAYSKQAHLDGKHTIFGKVIDGVDSTLDAVERVPVNAKNRPLNEIRLTNVKSQFLVQVLCKLFLADNDSCQSHSRCYTGRQTMKESSISGLYKLATNLRLEDKECRRPWYLGRCPLSNG